MRNQRADNRPVTLSKVFLKCEFSTEARMSINTGFLKNIYKLQLDDFAFETI